MGIASEGSAVEGSAFEGSTFDGSTFDGSDGASGSVVNLGDLSKPTICESGRECEEMCQEISILSGNCGKIVQNTEHEFVCKPRNLGGMDECLYSPGEADALSDQSDGTVGIVLGAVGAVAACLGITWCCCSRTKGDDLDTEKDIEDQKRAYPPNSDRRRLCH